MCVEYVLCVRASVRPFVNWDSLRSSTIFGDIWSSCWTNDVSNFILKRWNSSRLIKMSSLKGWLVFVSVFWTMSFMHNNKYFSTHTFQLQIKYITKKCILNMVNDFAPSDDSFTIWVLLWYYFFLSLSSENRELSLNHKMNVFLKM